MQFKRLSEVLGVLDEADCREDVRDRAEDRRDHRRKRRDDSD